MSDSVLSALSSNAPYAGAAAKAPDPVLTALNQPVSVPPTVPNSTQAPETWWQKALGWGVGPAEAQLHLATGMVAPAVAGLAGAAAWPFVGTDRAAGIVHNVEGDLTYQPHTPQGQAISAGVGRVLGSKWDPLQWPDVAGQAAGNWLADKGAPPSISTLARVAPDAAAMLAGREMLPEGTPKTPLTEGVRPGDVPIPEGAPVPEGAAAGATTAVPTEGSAPAAHGPFDEAPESGPNLELPKAEQLRRARVLNEIGLNGSQVRTSAVTGDPLAAGTDAQIARLDSPAGRQMKSVLQNERGALSNYADRIAQDTGGRMGSTETDAVARGESVQQALESLSGQYQTRISGLYKAADEAAKGVPTDLKGFQDVLSDDSLMTNQDRVGLRGGLNAYLKKLGVVDDNGNVTASVQQAETVRKYLNDEWSPQNSKLVGKLKDALDDDVTQAAGEDVYKQARALRAERGATLDNPKGIASLLDSSGPNGVNRVVPAEKVMSKLETMPVAQVDHVVTTLRGMGDDPLAQQALSDIKAHFAQRVAELGDKNDVQWNAKGVNQFLKNNSARLNSVFADDPAMLKRIYTLNEAGKVLRYDGSYPGAAAQAINYARSGIIPGLLQKGASIGGAVLGGAFGGPVGAGVVEALANTVGSKVAAGAAENAALRAARARVFTLGEQ